MDDKIQILGAAMGIDGVVLTTMPGDAEALATILGAINFPRITVLDADHVLLHWTADLPAEGEVRTEDQIPAGQTPDGQQGGIQ